jgi:Putative peptidoglycan binding domain
MTTRTEFVAAVLQGAKLPDSNACILAGLVVCQVQFGSEAGAEFNAWATTLGVDGATPFNTFDGDLHVWNYPSLAAGVEATAATLHNGDYQGVIDAFEAQNAQSICSAFDQSPWGGTDYLAALPYVEEHQAELGALAIAEPYVAPTFALSFPYLDHDSSGPIVEHVQQLLYLRGAGPNSIVTGTYDTATGTAMATFQKRWGVSADGVCGPDSLHALLFTSGEAPA